jgi:hypothetical protein
MCSRRTKGSIVTVKKGGKVAEVPVRRKGAEKAAAGAEEAVAAAEEAAVVTEEAVAEGAVGWLHRCWASQWTKLAH